MNTPDLATLAGTRQPGTWALTVQDNATADQGKILRFGVELGF